jgi:hypothetical protein
VEELFSLAIVGAKRIAEFPTTPPDPGLKLGQIEQFTVYSAGMHAKILPILQETV